MKTKELIALAREQANNPSLPGSPIIKTSVLMANRLEELLQHLVDAELKIARQAVYINALQNQQDTYRATNPDLHALSTPSEHAILS